MAESLGSVSDPVPLSPTRWLALAGASLAVFMVALDTNVVNVALPIMAGAFRVTGDVRWVTLAYILPTTALLGTFGALSDVVGRKRITLAGVIVFVAGSVLCGTAQSLTQMVVYRVLQGIGGSCIGSAIIAIATVNFAPGERGRAMAVIGLIAPLGAVVGPSLGGILIGALGWPAIFYMNVPFGIIAFAMVARFLVRDGRRGAAAFDGAGAALFTVALLLLMLGLSPHEGRLTTSDLALLAGCAAAVAAFIAVERRASHPLVPAQLVKRVSFSVPLVGIMTAGVAGTGLGFIAPFYLEGALRLTPEQAGLTLLFFPLGIAAASQVGGRLADRFQPKVPAALGAAVALAGVALFLPLSSTWRIVDVAVRLAIVGAGTGLFLSPSSVAVMAAAPREHVGVGGALTNTARYLGFALGPTLATLLWGPELQGETGLVAMRTVLAVLVGVQAATLATVLGYKAERKNGRMRPEAGASVGQAGHTISGVEAI